MAICTLFCVASLRKNPKPNDVDRIDHDGYDCHGGLIGGLLVVLAFWLAMGVVIF